MRTLPAMAAPTLALAATLMFSSAALGQEGSSVIIRRDDSGAQKVIHFSMPNLAELRTPDFTRKDLPIFIDKLVLSEAQAAATGRQIDAYLEAFRALTKDLAVTAGPDAEYIPDDETNDGAGNGQGGGKTAAVGLGGGTAASALDLGDLEAQLPPGTSIGIGVSMMAPAPRGEGGGNDGAAGGQAPPGARVRNGYGGEGAPPGARVAMGNFQPSVQVSIDSPEGEEIPQDVLDKIKQRADEMAAKMMEQIQAQLNGAGDAGPQKPGPVMVGRIEDMEARQAELAAKVEQFTKDKARLRSEFVTNAQANLGAEQVQRWPALERALTRERSLPRGRLAGESTDLVKVLASQKPGEAALESLASQVEAYEMALDAALKQRDAFIAQASQNIDQAIAEDKPERAVSIAERGSDLRVAVRTINQQYADVFAQALGERGEAFRTAALKAFYPQVYRQTRGQKAFAALDKAGVDAAHANDLAALRSAYDAELLAINEHIRQTMDREQPKQAQRSMQQLKRTMRGQDGGGGPGAGMMQQEDPIREALEKRAELDDRYLKTIHGMLPPEMANSLPKPRTHKGPIVIRSGA